jgi:WD40 repeat protein
VVFRSDGKTIASRSSDATIRIWSVESGKSLATLRGHAGGVSAVAYRNDGTTLASVGTGATVKLWSRESWQRSR